MFASIAVVLLAGVVGMAPPDRRPIVLTTDIGTEIDDHWALAHIALTPEFDLKGVVTNHSPSLATPASESAAKFARELVDKLPVKVRPPVIAGAARSLPDPLKPLANAGVDFLIEQAKGRKSDDRLIVVVIGTATDVASALLIDPTWADRVVVVAMGFDGYPKGGDPWNVKNDPIAWRILLDSRAPITVGDVEITKRTLRMTPDRVHTLMAQLPEPGPILLNRFDTWIAKNARHAQDETGSPVVWPIWDEVTTAYLLGMAKAETRPRPRLRDDLTFDLDNPKGTIDWIVSVDEARLWSDLVTKIKAGGN